MHLNENDGKDWDEQNQPANTGNASNPSPGNEEMQPISNNQILDEKAEKYLQEGGNIEDVPDAEDQQDMDETMEKEGNK